MSVPKIKSCYYNIIIIHDLPEMPHVALLLLVVLIVGDFTVASMATSCGPDQSSKECQDWSARRSWVIVDADSHFPIQNIPFGIFSIHTGKPRVGTAIGDFVLDLHAVAKLGLFSHIQGLPDDVFAMPSLNAFMELPRRVWRAVRQQVADLLLEGSKEEHKLRAHLFPASEVTMHLPVQVKEYTDFYSSREHAMNVGTMFRGKENALQPNWLHLPVGYHGRASSIVLSGTDVLRPCGQVQKDPANAKLGPIFRPSNALDFELEVAVLLGGPPNPIGKPIEIAEAEERIFGLVLLNDWSARDIQAWEYVPLGPFTSKNFATSISAWVVSLDALQPFRCSPSAGLVQDDPTPVEYLVDPDYHRGSYNVRLEVGIQPENEIEASVVSISNYRNQYWNMKQQLAHHSITGSVMRPGDLLGSGTISGADETAYGSMLELSWRGAKEVVLSNSAQTPKQVRKFLQDGDKVFMTGYAQGDGYRVGFGSVEGRVLPAVSTHLPK